MREQVPATGAVTVVVEPGAEDEVGSNEEEGLAPSCGRYSARSGLAGRLQCGMKELGFDRLVSIGSKSQPRAP
jgi:hypothetical protein